MASRRQLAMNYSTALDTVVIHHVSRNYHVEVCLISSLFCLFGLLRHFDRKMSNQKKSRSHGKTNRNFTCMKNLVVSPWDRLFGITIYFKLCTTKTHLFFLLHFDRILSDQKKSRSHGKTNRNFTCMKNLLVSPWDRLFRITIYFKKHFYTHKFLPPLYK